MTISSYSLKKNDPEKIRKKIAELPSLYSDVECKTISANVTSAKQALVLIYISLYFPVWESEKLIRTISQKCFAQNYNGEWKTVQDFLEIEFKTPKDFETKYCSEKGPHDFFGNFLPKAERNIRAIKITDLTKKNRTKVVYPIFHRGYKDKGSLRLPSDSHGIRPYKEKEDRRPLVFHPLVREILIQGEENVPDTHPNERRFYNDLT